MEDLKNKGLFNKYQIAKSNGNPIDPRAKYFILRYDQFGSDPKHTEACRLALSQYALAIEDHLPVLSQELKSELIKIENELGASNAE